MIKNLRWLLAWVLLLSAFNTAIAASYDYIDEGDFYYINRWGDDNEYVVVIRKLGDSDVKVRNMDTGATIVVKASQLLTKSELDTEETVNTVGGAAIVLCLLSEDCRSSK